MNIVFDIGQVLLIWDPLLLYQTLIPDDNERNYWFTHIFSASWRERSDYELTVNENCQQLVEVHPDKQDIIMKWDSEFFTMMPGLVSGAADLVEDIQRKGHKVFAIANFSSDKYTEAKTRFPILSNLDGMLVSSDAFVRKPQPEIYNIFLNKYELNSSECIFVDDDAHNVHVAIATDMMGIVFSSTQEIRKILATKQIV